MSFRFQHWVANNILGLAFAVNGIEILQLNTVGIGCILLGGLFFYDIFWVSISAHLFCTSCFTTSSYQINTGLVYNFRINTQI
mgnify:CR=1 FL=1